jgi:hypothetical protein
MNATQKKFILKKLIPFILREQGRGFDMYSWIQKGKVGTEYRPETSREREFPSCGMVACIGGSIQILQKKTKCEVHLGNTLGLTKDQRELLFYGWDMWPKPYAKQYHNAKTPHKQALVAVRLLKAIVRTDAKILQDALESQGYENQEY